MPPMAGGSLKQRKITITAGGCDRQVARKRSISSWRRCSRRYLRACWAINTPAPWFVG